MNVNISRKHVVLMSSSYKEKTNALLFSFLGKTDVLSCLVLSENR